MFGNIVPMSAVGSGQGMSGNVLPTTTVSNNDLVIIQDTTTATSQAELINQLQNHITENQQILIITDDQGQDQCKRTSVVFFAIALHCSLLRRCDHRQRSGHQCTSAGW